MDNALEPEESTLGILCDLHNNIGAKSLHEALPYMEDAVKTKPEMSAREFLGRWRMRAQLLDSKLYE